MKSLKNRIIPRWEAEVRFALPLHRHAPVARRAPEFMPETFYQNEEAWNISMPLLWL
jgi:hypothetical protein